MGPGTRRRCNAHRDPGVAARSELGIRYLPYSELQNHRGAITRFGSGIKPLMEISQSL